MLLDEVVANAYSSSNAVKVLLLDPPLKEVARARRDFASPSEAAMGDSLQHHEPPAIVQSQEQSSGQPIEQPNERPEGG